MPVTIYPLTNDISPNGDALTITNATTTNGIVVINPGNTNLTFTPTNTGTATITYTIADAHGGTSTAVITVTVTELADLAIGKTAFAIRAGDEQSDLHDFRDEPRPVARQFCGGDGRAAGGCDFCGRQR